MREGFRLEFPEGDVFEAKHNVESTIDQQTTWLFDGSGNAAALYEQFLDQQQGTSNSIKQSTFLGTGAGVRRFNFQFEQFEGSTEQWGDASAGDSMTTKRDVLDHALSTQRITSENPLLLEHGEFSTSGIYNPVTVVHGQSSLTVDYFQDSSVMRGQLELLDAADLGNVQTANGLTG